MRRSNEAGESYSEAFDVRIDAEGEFYTHPSEEILASIRTLELPKCAVTKPRSNSPWRVSCATLKGLEDALGAAIDESLTVDESTERVIVYAKQTDLSVWQDRDGSLHANGYIGRDSHKQGGEWRDAGSVVNAAHSSTCFSIGLVARVFDKITYSRPNSQRVVLVAPDWGDHLDFSTWGAKLNGFVVKLPSDPANLDQMPYTEDAAKFFYDAMIEIAAAGLRMHEFFSEKSNIEQAIERGATPLLGQVVHSQWGYSLP